MERRTDRTAREPGDSSDQYAALVGESSHRLGGQTRRHWPVLASLAAVIGIVALGAALVALGAMNVSPAPRTVGPRVVAARPGAPLPKGVEVTAFAPMGPDEYWATGEILTNNVSGWPDESVILRFSGGRWAQVGGGLASVELAGLQMVSASEGWAWGQNGSGAGVLLHIIGGRWTRVSALAADPGGSPQLMRMRTADEGWLVMQNPKSSSGDTSPSSLLHYVSGAWRLIRTPLLYFRDVAPVNPNEAWLLGSYGHGIVVVHLVDGRSTVAWQAPQSALLSSLRELAPDDIWAMGVILPAEPTPPAQPASPDSLRPALYHYDGSSWQPVSVQAPAGVEQVQIVSGNDMWAMRSGTSPAKPGQRPSPSELDWRIQALYHFSAGQWRRLALPYTDLMRLVILPSPATASGEVWALGVYTSPLPSSDGGHGYAGIGHTVLLQYVNGVWVEYGR